MNVVVHRKEKWCQCPGLGVAAQVPSLGGASAVGLANALFEAFLGEAAQEPEPRRCLTVTLEVGAGRHWPWVRPSHYAFSIWRRRTDDRWVLFQYAVPPSERRAAAALLHARWPA